MKTSSKLQALCAEVKELDEKATPGPWDGITVIPVVKENTDLLHCYRTACPKLALACEVMMEALGNIADKHSVRWDSSVPIGMANKALAEVEAILKENKSNLGQTENE